MPNFMIAYHGGDKPNSQEEGMAHMTKWKAWVEGLGDAVINPGTPLMHTKVVSSEAVHDETKPDSMKGYAVIKAKSMDIAIEIAKADPFLSINGVIRISQIMEMN